ncbi:unnamed protein product [Soboliphyme baturini]|uniref:EF-hand domain-containing protein n=1 Tax=Soboliphyme baturini TaxID=241478 RepID=A0A183IQW9_9BILA|nr:unnamed protein product [Soboliphyme baturini]
MVLDAFYSAFSWLPVATIVNKSVFIVHGGISENTDLEAISLIDRSKYKSFLISPYEWQSSPRTVQNEMKLLTDLFWSDPQTKNGIASNVSRGAGVCYGPNVTQSFLEKNKLKLLIRSHECVVDGYEYCQQNQVLTVFSASNYYATGSNKGAYVKLIGPELEPHFVQYVGSKSYAKTQFYVNTFCDILCEVTKLCLPWHMIVGSIARKTRNGKFVYYKTILEGCDVYLRMNERNPKILEAIYKNSDLLESVFRFMDKDSSGYITLDEFEDTCLLLNKYSNSQLTKSAIRSIANTMDINKDGSIDLNEFFEAFRMANLVYFALRMEREIVPGRLKLKKPIKKSKKKINDVAKVSVAAVAPTGRVVEPVVRKTKSEIAFEQRWKELQMQRIIKKAQSSHREKVEQFNQYLDSLTELNDIPKVSWTK